MPPSIKPAQIEMPPAAMFGLLPLRFNVPPFTMTPCPDGSALALLSCSVPPVRLVPPV